MNNTILAHGYYTAMLLHPIPAWEVLNRNTYDIYTNDVMIGTDGETSHYCDEPHGLPASDEHTTSRELSTLEQEANALLEADGDAMRYQPSQVVTADVFYNARTVGELTVNADNTYRLSYLEALDRVSELQTDAGADAITAQREAIRARTHYKVQNAVLSAERAATRTSAKAERAKARRAAWEANRVS